MLVAGRQYLAISLFSRAILVAAMLTTVGSAKAGQPTTQPVARESIWWQPLTEPIVTDRPDFTESALAVPAGHFQLEGGYTYASDRENGRRAIDQAVPELLLRVGVVRDFELRLGWPGWSLTQETFRERNDVGRTVTRLNHDDGNDDLYLGFKARLVKQNGWVPDFAIMPAVTVPSGSTSKTSGDVDPELKLAWGHDLTERLAVSGNVNIAVPTEDVHRFVQTAASVSFGYRLTERIGAYAEYFGFYPATSGGEAAHYANGGFTFLITENLQFDIRAGVGLNDAADDYFVGTGFAVRF